MNRITPENFYYSYIRIEPRLCEMSRHMHPMLELIYIVRGDLLHVVEDRVYTLSRGDLVLVQPGKYHDIRFTSDREYERCNILIDPVALGLSYAMPISERFEVISLSALPRTAEIFTRLEEYRAALPQEAFPEAAVHLLFELFYDLSIAGLEERRYSKLHPLLSEALSYIAENLYRIGSVSEIASALHVTESYLFRLFRRELNTTPRKYVSDKRLLAAEGMLRLGHRPTEVFAACGFSDYTTFFRSYKRFFGVAPSRG